MPALIPIHILRQLSPAATKIYLTFITQTDQSVFSISLPIRTLARQTGYSPRSCTLALRQLRTLNLLVPHPRRYHAPAAYMVGTPPTKDQFDQTQAQSAPVMAQPIAPVNAENLPSHPQESTSTPSPSMENSSQPKAKFTPQNAPLAAPAPSQNLPSNPQEPTFSSPIPSENSAPTNAQPIAPLSPRALRSLNKTLRNPSLTARIYHVSTPPQRQAIIDHAARTLARLIAQANEYEQSKNSI